MSEEDWSTVSLSVDALRPFEEVTKEISTEKHASVSKVIPFVKLLRRSTASHESQGIKLAAELSAHCQHCFRAIETCYGLAVSSLLDLRFKNFGFTDMANVEAVKKRMITEMQSVNQTSVPAPEPSVTG